MNQKQQYLAYKIRLILIIACCALIAHCEDNKTNVLPTQEIQTKPTNIIAQ